MKQPSFHSRPHADGFTLVELLVVIVIAALLSFLTVPMIASLIRSSNVSTATASIATLLEQARATAMAKNTYVFVGFEETNYATPKTATQTPGTGRVAVQVFSSLDGTLNLQAANLQAVSRVQVFDNLDLPASLSSATGTLSNKAKLQSAADVISSSSGFPTVSSTSAIVSGNYTYTMIVAFDSGGALHLPTSPQTTLQYLEVDLQQSNGTTIPTTSNNQSAIQVDGLTGAVIIYRS